MNTASNICAQFCDVVLELTRWPRPKIIKMPTIAFDAPDRVLRGKIGEPLVPSQAIVENRHRLEARRVQIFPIALYEILSILDADDPQTRKTGWSMMDHLHLQPNGKLSAWTDGTFQRLFTFKEAKQILLDESMKLASAPEDLKREIGVNIMPYSQLPGTPIPDPA